jgi:hypothetical protein
LSLAASSEGTNSMLPSALMQAIERERLPVTCQSRKATTMRRE